jgi:hypothetical protein
MFGLVHFNTSSIHWSQDITTGHYPEGMCERVYRAYIEESTRNPMFPQIRVSAIVMVAMGCLLGYPPRPFVNDRNDRRTTCAIPRN